MKLVFEHIAETNSTSDDLLARIDEVKNNHYVIIRSCDKQYQGRGQQHKKWYHPKEAILCSMAFSYEVKGFTALIVGLAITDALVLLFPTLKSLLKIKWPNDLLIKNRGLALNQNEDFFYKIGGILLEYRQGILVIGFGINLRNDACNSELTAYCLFNYIDNIDNIKHIKNKEISTATKQEKQEKQEIIHIIAIHILQFLEESKHHFCEKHQQLWHEYSALQPNTLINQGIYQSIDFQTGTIKIDDVSHTSITVDWPQLKKYL